MMDEPSKFETADWYLDHFDQALSEDDAVVKDSPLLSELVSISQRYSPRQEINQGGQKKILACVDDTTKRELAMAVLHDAKKVSAIESFIREARIAASLEHPNIVPVYDLGVNEQSEPFFTMKRLGGKNLQEILDQPAHGLSQDQLLEVLLKVCDAVEYAHSRGIVHLDLKPANIQVDEYGQVLVCDWGLARQLENGAVEGEAEQQGVTVSGSEGPLQVGESVDGRIKGSPGFMSPEQMDTTLGARTLRTDIYALGAILYAILCGESPNGSESLDTVVERTLSGQLTAPRALRPENNIPASLSAVSMKALAPKPADRYASVQQLSAEIRAFTRGFVTEAEGASIVTILLKCVKRHRSLSVVVLMSAVTILSLVIFFILRLSTEKDMAESARRDAEHSEQKAQGLVKDLHWEKVARLKVSKTAAASFHKEALLDYEKGDYVKALEAVTYVVALDPELKSAWNLRARLLFGEFRFRAAIESARQGTMKEKQQWLIGQAEAALAVTNLALPPADFIYDQRRRVIDSKHHFQHLHQHMFRSMVREYPLEDRWQFARLSYQYNHREHAKMDLANCFVVERMGDFYRLSVKGSKGTALTLVLSGLPLVELDLSNTSTKELSGLRGMPLKKLDLSNSSVTSIAVLSDLPIENLNLDQTQVLEIAPLIKTPIRVLTLGSYPMKLEPLRRCKSLEKLVIPKDVYNEKLLSKLGLLDKVEYR